MARHPPIPGTGAGRTSPAPRSPRLSNSPRLGSSSPLLPTTRQLSIRSPALIPHGSPYSSSYSFRPPKPRRALLITAALSLALFLWSKTSSSPWTRSRGPFSPQELEKCRLYPWMAACMSSPWGDDDPFEGLHYEKEFGHMFYPAHSASEEETAIPPNQPHPIHLLMNDARRDWGRKVARQSGSIREAVQEYERRYKMRPPKLFAEWFEFAKANNFILVDEFDALHRKILPYLALPSSVLRKRGDKLQHDKEFWLQDKTFTVEIRKKAGVTDVKVVGPMAVGRNERPEQMVALLQPFAERLPEMNITFTGHDVPWVGLSGEARARMHAAAKAGTYIDPKYYEDYQDNWDYDGWASICPPGSPIRTEKRFDDRINIMAKRRPSFIYDHVASMDLCTHPDTQNLHGFTAWPGPRPGLLYPIFSFTSTSIHADLPAPPIDQYDYPQGIDPPWEEKGVDKVVWRGSTTGADLNIPHMRKWSQRPRLCALGREGGTITLPYAPNDKSDELGSSELFSSPLNILASNYFDFKFLGEPTQCADPEACAEFKKEHAWSPWMSQDDQNKYKYVIDVDGNGWSGRFHRLMNSSTMVLKSTIFPEWYSEHVQPWLHYVPVATDYKDLFPIMAFFKGGKEGIGSHDALAKEIGLAGQHWAQNHWRMIDIQVYFYRLLIEYDRIMNREDDDPTSMDM
ncbi:hypothetical protein T439DRAFT_323438 [Meredithblackwellia eburnea MCA 4105]